MRPNGAALGSSTGLGDAGGSEGAGEVVGRGGIVGEPVRLGEIDACGETVPLDSGSRAQLAAIDNAATRMTAPAFLMTLRESPSEVGTVHLSGAGLQSRARGQRTARSAIVLRVFPTSPFGGACALRCA
jgi:hypothetical protein